MKKGFIAINTFNINKTSEYLGSIKEIHNIQFGMYDADILAEVHYDNLPEDIHNEVKNAPGVYGTKTFW